MKKYLLLFISLIMAITLLSGCTESVDTSKYEDEIEELEDEIYSLEDEIKQLNNTLADYEAMPTITPVPEGAPTPEPTAEPTPVPDYYSLGDTVEFDGLELTFISVSVEPVGNRYADFEEAVVIHATAKNISDETKGYNMFYGKMFGPSGTEVGTASAYFDDSLDWAGEMRPDATLEGSICYQYTENGQYILVLDDWSNEIEIWFDVEK